MGSKSRSKGARGEREAAAFLNSLGFTAERNGRNGYSADDLIVKELPNVHIEVKRDESIDVGTVALSEALSQAGSNAGGRVAVVLWRKNRGGWRLTYLGEHGFSVTCVAFGVVLLWLNERNRP